MEEAVDGFDEIIKIGFESISISEAKEHLDINIRVQTDREVSYMSSIEDKKTCAERIVDEFHSRESYIYDIYNAIENDEPYEGYEDAQRLLDELPLGYDCHKVIDIHLSTGGPGDWLSVKINEIDGQVMSVHYHFNDWFDHASMVVDDDSPLYTYAIDFVDSLGY